MGAFFKRCRGALGIGVIWGAAWAAFFAALSLIVGVLDPPTIDPGEGPLRLAGIGAVVGFASGVAFGVLLSLTETRKTIRDLSLGRAALWGMLGAAALPLLTPMNNSTLVTVCPIGAALAVASVAVAKRAELRGRAERPTLPG